MSKQIQQSAAGQRAAGASSQRAEPGRRWAIVLMVVVGVAVLALVGYVVKRHFFPNYWTADDLGPARINDARAPGPAPEGMVWIPGGVFWMGSDDFPDAKPVHKVYVDGFWMDRTEVTNEQFAKFVEATGYVTVVERWPDPAKMEPFKPEHFGFQPEYLACLGLAPEVGFPGGLSWTGVTSARPLLKPFSLVFTQSSRPLDPKTNHPRNWWRKVAWANWKHPEGPGSSLRGLEKHPVVQICYEDAVAYARWVGKRLPTEAEWEFAARGGLDRKRFHWEGNEPMPGKKPMANIWQGNFPYHNTLEDGYARTAPVGSYLANGFDLRDMSGNVWEWCADWYKPGYPPELAPRNPKGPESSDPDQLIRVQRGGSFLCCDNSCIRYMAGARGGGDPESTGNHIGFRCVKAAE